MTKQLKIGTRGSPLALAQATITRDLLIRSGLVAEDAIETVIIKTSGDRIQDRSLADIGGKGLFTKEIEEALADGRIDMAVHSLKDLPAWMPEGLGLAAVLTRADPRDALLSPVATSIDHAAARARASARPARAARRCCSIAGPTSPSSIFAAMSARGSTSWQRVRSMARCWRSPAWRGWDLTSITTRSIQLRCCRRPARAPSGWKSGWTTNGRNRSATLSATLFRRSLLRPSGRSLRRSTVHAARRSRRWRQSTAIGSRLEGLVARPDGTAVIRVHEQASLADAARLGRGRAGSRPICRWTSSSRRNCRRLSAGNGRPCRHHPPARRGALGSRRFRLARGYDTLVEPMLDIVPLPAAIPDLGHYRALAFTSANGVRVFAERSADRSLPAYAVGTRTADSLRKAGFTDVRGAPGDAEALAEFIGETLGGGPLLHVCAKEVARELDALLAPAIAVDRLVLYEAVAGRNFLEGLGRCAVRVYDRQRTVLLGTYGGDFRNLGCEIRFGRNDHLHIRALPQQTGCRRGGEAALAHSHGGARTNDPVACRAAAPSRPWTVTLNLRRPPPAPSPKALSTASAAFVRWRPSSRFRSPLSRAGKSGASFPRFVMPISSPPPPAKTSPSIPPNSPRPIRRHFPGPNRARLSNPRLSRARTAGRRQACTDLSRPSQVRR